MSTTTAEDVTQAIRSFNESMYGQPIDGFDTIGWDVPTFTTQDQVDRFTALGYDITGQHETRNGVAWVATVTIDGHAFHAENDGNGGCNFYHGDPSALSDAEGFAEELYPEGIEALDTLLTARESYGFAAEMGVVGTVTP